MTNHVNPRLLAGTALRAPETKDADAAALGADVKKAVDDLAKTFADFRSKNDERLAQIEKKGSADVVTKDEVDRINKGIDAAIDKAKAEIKARVDDLEAKANRLALGQGGGDGKKQQTPEQIEYGKKFEEFFRQGEEAVGGKSALRALEKKAIAASSDNDPSGGFTVRPEIDTTIDATLKEVSPIRQIAGNRRIGTGLYKRLVNKHGASSGWVGERESRIQTLAPDLDELEYPVMEIYAMPAATQELLDDSTIDIGQWIAGEVDLEFAQQEGRAFISGDGVKKPRGFISGYDVVAESSYTWGKIGYVPTGAAGAFAGSAPADALIDLVFTLKGPYRANANFVANRKSMASIRKLKDGDGNYLVAPRLGDRAMFEAILGYPVVEADDMPDIAANSLSIAFGDFRRGYIVIDRIGTRVLRDPYTAKPYVLFYTTKRVGGGVANFEAIKLLKFAVS